MRAKSWIDWETVHDQHYMFQVLKILNPQTCEYTNFIVCDDGDDGYFVVDDDEFLFFCCHPREFETPIEELFIDACESEEIADLAQRFADMKKSGEYHPLNNELVKTEFNLLMNYAKYQRIYNVVYGCTFDE